MIQNPHLITTAFHIFPKGHYRATVHGDVTHAPRESFFLNSTLVDFTTVWMILQGLTQIRILNSLMFPKEVRPGCRKWKTMLCFDVFLCSLES